MEDNNNYLSGLDTNTYNAKDMEQCQSVISLVCRMAYEEVWCLADKLDIKERVCSGVIDSKSIYNEDFKSFQSIINKWALRDCILLELFNKCNKFDEGIDSEIVYRMFIFSGRIEDIRNIDLKKLDELAKELSPVDYSFGREFDETVSIERIIQIIQVKLSNDKIYELLNAEYLREVVNVLSGLLYLADFKEFIIGGNKKPKFKTNLTDNKLIQIKTLLVSKSCIVEISDSDFLYWFGENKPGSITKMQWLKGNQALANVINLICGRGSDKKQAIRSAFNIPDFNTNPNNKDKNDNNTDKTTIQLQEELNAIIAE